MNEFESEPVKGLPQTLPPDERILWQGAPRWTSLARRAYHARKVAAYFGLLIAWRLIDASTSGATTAELTGSAVRLSLIAIACVALLHLLAWFAARGTVYTITNRRVVLRIGVAIQIAINVPFSVVESAALKLHSDGTGDLPLVLRGNGRVGYVPLWPHARPWRFSKPEPMLRAVPSAAHVAGILADALTRSRGDVEPHAQPRSAQSSPGPSVEDAGDDRSPPLAAEVAA